MNLLAVYLGQHLGHLGIGSRVVRNGLIDGGAHAIQLGLIRSGHQASLGSGSLVIGGILRRDAQLGDPC